ncbi:hypothetical protein TL16_g00176 [Triparma laevis f. inornata]|uniref:peptidylprolyl isomerase n=1 Tax=Triparma laevis f. inornata TaxID=1714386 RepID=A0A9W7DLF1_9STRA|nr:hypothetical protein TL16_g00176 [Triparma laevis f. inornata]
MHRSPLTSLHLSSTSGMLLTTSSDGIVKFWKRTGDVESFEFVKSYVSHAGVVVCGGVSGGSTGGSLGATIGEDGVIKFYDMDQFDVSGMIKTSCDFGSSCCFVLNSQTALAVAMRDTGKIQIYDTLTMSEVPSKVVSIHPEAVTGMMYYDKTVISTDTSGLITYWNAEGDGSDPSTLGGTVTSSTTSSVTFSDPILETDLYSMLKKKKSILTTAIGSTGKFALYGEDRRIRLFDFKTGKCLAKYDDTEKGFEKEMEAGKFEFDRIEFGQRMAREKEVGKAGGMSFDCTGRMLIYPSLVGIKVIDTMTHRLVRTLGSADASQTRFLNILVCNVDAKLDKQMMLARDNSKSNKAVDRREGAEVDNDPLIVASAFEKKRFYAFSKFGHMNDDLESRDVFNEPPDAEDMLINSAAAAANSTMGSSAILRTSMGDIHVKLFGAEAPRTIENFVGHSKSGYYDGTIMHRVIKGFMVQMGDPKGDGTGGESIWGGEFEDEICRDLRHDRPFTLSMANAGPGTNGSQFFITTVPTPWLDGKHTVFGRVTRGMDVVVSIENSLTDHLDKPATDIKILNIEIE